MQHSGGSGRSISGDLSNAEDTQIQSKLDGEPSEESGTVSATDPKQKLTILKRKRQADDRRVDEYLGVEDSEAKRLRKEEIKKINEIVNQELMREMRSDFNVFTEERAHIGFPKKGRHKIDTFGF